MKRAERSLQQLFRTETSTLFAVCDQSIGELLENICKEKKLTMKKNYTYLHW